MVTRMVRNVQRLGGGLGRRDGHLLAGFSSPESLVESFAERFGVDKATSRGNRLGGERSAGRSRRLVPVKPCIHGIRIAWFQESARGDLMGSLAVRDLQKRGSPFTDKGTGVVVTQLK